MVYGARNLPTVNEVGRMLETEGLVAFRKRAYVQTDWKCFEIASRIAELFGYQPLTSIQELTGLIVDTRIERLRGNSSSPTFSRRTPVSLVIRKDYNPDHVHVALEAYGREYNYAAATRQGFLEEMRIPLCKLRSE